MAEIAMNALVARREGLLATELDGEVVLMSIEHGAYYGVEDTARRIWELLEQPRRVSELCESLTAEYQVDPETCQADLLRFLGQLLDEGLIVVA